MLKPLARSPYVRPAMVAICAGLIFLSQLEHLTRLSAAAISGHAIFQKPVTPSNESVHCILYDRPPRTGSTTIAEALYKCLRRKRYTSLPAMPKHGRTGIITDMLNKTSNLRSSIKPHLVLSRSDGEQLRQTCARFLYISSAGEITKRIVSQMKYGVFDGHGNQSVAATTLLSTLRRRSLDKLRAQEAFLESYPYAVEEGVREDERLQPNYVIRQQFLEDDLHKLLTALRCDDIALESQNVHRLVDAAVENGLKPDDAFREAGLHLQENVLLLADSRYTQLTGLADAKNEDGLRLARDL